MEALKSKEEGLPGKALEALGKIGPAAKEAVPALVEIVKNGKKAMRKQAGDALKRIDPKAAAKAGVR